MIIFIYLCYFTAPDNYEPPNVDPYQNAGDDAGDAPGGVKARAVYDYQASKCLIAYVFRCSALRAHFARKNNPYSLRRLKTHMLVCIAN